MERKETSNPNRYYGQCTITSSTHINGINKRCGLTMIWLAIQLPVCMSIEVYFSNAPIFHQSVNHIYYEKYLQFIQSVLKMNRNQAMDFQLTATMTIRFYRVYFIHILRQRSSLLLYICNLNYIDFKYV